MREDLTDLWSFPCDARCITTSGTVKANGRAVMGRGTAKQAVDRYFVVALALGKLITREGLHVAVLDRNCDGVPLLVFPVKYYWDERADLVLIERSANELVTLTNIEGWQKVVLPRPGCGNGSLKWESQVRPVIQPILDDRFTVITL